MNAAFASKEHLEIILEPFKLPFIKNITNINFTDMCNRDCNNCHYYMLEPESPTSTIKFRICEIRRSVNSILGLFPKKE